MIAGTHLSEAAFGVENNNKEESMEFFSSPIRRFFRARLEDSDYGFDFFFVIIRELDLRHFYHLRERLWRFSRRDPFELVYWNCHSSSSPQSREGSLRLWISTPLRKKRTTRLAVCAFLIAFQRYMIRRACREMKNNKYSLIIILFLAQTSYSSLLLILIFFIPWLFWNKHDTLRKKIYGSRVALIMLDIHYPK